MHQVPSASNGWTEASSLPRTRLLSDVYDPYPLDLYAQDKRHLLLVGERVLAARHHCHDLAVEVSDPALGLEEDMRLARCLVDGLVHDLSGGESGADVTALSARRWTQVAVGLEEKRRRRERLVRRAEDGQRCDRHLHRGRALRAARSDVAATRAMASATRRT